MRKELEEVLSKNVEDMTAEDARFYDMALNHNKRLIKGSAIFMAGATALALAAGFGFGFALNLTLGVILGIAIELAGLHCNLFYVLADTDQHIADKSFCFEKGEKKEFKNAHGFEKMKQLLTDYEKLHGKSYLDEENDTQTYEEYLKTIEQAPTNEQTSVTKTKIQKADEAEQTIADNEQENKTL